MTNTPQQQPPGWYYAEGDPPGTNRYWDGAQWQGDSQVVGGGTPVAAGAAGGRQRAEVGSRFIAYLIDAAIIFGIYIVIIILAGILGSISDTLGSLVGILGFFAYIGYWFYNFVFLQGTTGQTLGKKQQGIALLDSTTFQPLGIGGAFIRNILVGIFAMPCGLDHWWILVDSDNLRLSDKVLGNQVYQA